MRAKKNSNVLRVLRGGSFISAPERLRCTYCFRNSPVLRNRSVSLRVVIRR